MATDTNGYLHLTRPVTAGALTSAFTVSIQPAALFSILDHSQRRPSDQERVIGTLLGTRSDDSSSDATVTIHSAFAVGHTLNSQDELEVDIEYQKAMLALHLRSNPKEILVGWYATDSTLDVYSALIQNHYSSPQDGTYPHPAVHLSVGCKPGQDIEIHAYISSPVGVTAERAADSAAFIPVPWSISYSDSDLAALSSISAAKDVESRTTTILTEIEQLEKSLEDTLSLLHRVSVYVESILDEEVENPSTALGQYLLNTLALAPKVDPAEIEKDFNNHIQDVLTVSYLANTIRTQMDLSNRLALAQLTIGRGTEGAAASGSTAAAGAGNENKGNRDHHSKARLRAEGAPPLTAVVL
ncbi:hypothetical protein DV735_g2578, partial [Chaetothyriales sp. CBS 134920]